MKVRVWYWRAHRKGGEREVFIDFKLTKVPDVRRETADVEIEGAVSEKALAAAVKKATGDKVLKIDKHEAIKEPKPQEA